MSFNVCLGFVLGFISRNAIIVLFLFNSVPLCCLFGQTKVSNYLMAQNHSGFKGPLPECTFGRSTTSHFLAC